MVKSSEAHINYDRQWFIVVKKMHELRPPAVELRDELILKLFPLKGNNLTCLDVGCGYGKYTLELLKRGFSVHAFDGSEDAVKKLKESVPEDSSGRLTAQAATIENFTSTARYDFILVSEVLEHIKDDCGAVKKLFSLLKEDGRMIISVPHDMKLWTVTDTFVGHLRRYSKESLIKILPSGKIKIEKMWCYGFPFLWMVRLLRKIFCMGPEYIVAKTTKPTFYGTLLKICTWILGRLLFFDRLFLNVFTGIGLITVIVKHNGINKD
ncbi:MAG: class I SAM-dependent methyltransferase [bacterium]